MRDTLGLRWSIRRRVRAGGARNYAPVGDWYGLPSSTKIHGRKVLESADRAFITSQSASRHPRSAGPTERAGDQADDETPRIGAGGC